MEKILKKIINKIMNCILKGKKKNIVIIGGWFGRRFSDNSRYLYLYLNENKDHYNLEKIIWITENKYLCKEIKEKFKYEVYMKYSIKSIYYHIIAKYHIVDQGRRDIFGILSNRAIKINLWHGLPLKQISKFVKGSDIQLGNWNRKYILTCSSFGDNTLGKAFEINKKKMLHGMYPRNYFLMQEINNILLESEKVILEKIKKEKKNKRIVFYLPTFRKIKNSIFLGETSQEKLNRFFKFLEENNIYFISKFHFVGEKILKKDKQDIENINFLNLPSEMDVYPFLKETDILITDYSSVYYDFLYLNKDIIFYPYDLEEYKNNDQGLLFDYDKMTPGDKVYNLEELQENLKKKLYQRDSYEEERKKLLKLCFEDYTIEDTVNNILSLEEE